MFSIGIQVILALVYEEPSYLTSQIRCVRKGKEGNKTVVGVRTLHL